ncbi:acylphosphatase [Anaerolineales bacterium HSG6]|nr:acylphosphatase [Anaerolineales bacterium HSG6]MDM8529728.1 acylphosphatase [Anaerolineales bacterium HSG25]
MENLEKLQVHVMVSGRVQGVSFRWHTQREAQTYDLTGWVRNLSDGRVEALFEGESQAIHEIIAWCYMGPTSAQVDNVEVDYRAPTNEFTGFKITW